MFIIIKRLFYKIKDYIKDNYNNYLLLGFNFP